MHVTSILTCAHMQYNYAYTAMRKVIQDNDITPEGNQIILLMYS